MKGKLDVINVRTISLKDLSYRDRAMIKEQHRKKAAKEIRYLLHDIIIFIAEVLMISSLFGFFTALALSKADNYRVPVSLTIISFSILAGTLIIDRIMGYDVAKKLKEDAEDKEDDYYILYDNGIIKDKDYVEMKEIKEETL